MMDEEIERWKFEVRQAMIDYACAEKRGDPAAIDATSQHACDLVDELASKVAAERERMRAAADSRASHEASAVEHHAGKWHEAYQCHLTRHAAMRDLIDAVFGPN